MNCKKARHGIINGELSADVAAHISGCDACRGLQEKVNATMSLLDQEITVPETLAASILAARDDIVPREPRKMKLVTYVQVAAAVCFGIFIGHQFGRYAGPVERTASTDPVRQYLKAHHFELDHSDINSPSFFNYNPND